MGKTTNNLLAAAERAINEQVVDLSAVRDLHADTAVKLGLVDSSGTPTCCGCSTSASG